MMASPYTQIISDVAISWFTSVCHIMLTFAHEIGISFLFACTVILVVIVGLIWQYGLVARAICISWASCSSVWITNTMCCNYWTNSQPCKVLAVSHSWDRWRSAIISNSIVDSVTSTSSNGIWFVTLHTEESYANYKNWRMSNQLS
jgi:hypothetical protein